MRWPLRRVWIPPVTGWAIRGPYGEFVRTVYPEPGAVIEYSIGDTMHLTSYRPGYFVWRWNW